jgi:hypothetical protein
MPPKEVGYVLALCVLPDVSTQHIGNDKNNEEYEKKNIGRYAVAVARYNLVKIII